MIFLTEDINRLETRYRGNLINSITGFKSVSLVGTKSDRGLTNLAPISQIVHVGANPPLLGLLFRPNVVPRHTLENIQKTKCFTVNHINAGFLEKAHHTAARWEGSEFDHCGLSEHYINGIEVPFVGESHLKIACELKEQLEIQSNGTHFLVGQITYIEIPDETLSPDGYVDIEAAGTITCSGLDSYHSTSRLARFTYAKPDHQPKKL
ncbi:MAG: flavin oxidoreductase [Flammeovirgaceae bacterium]|nr:flavin oxidoreductase [Flammeovirgaceae bacterium]MBE61908.1 flavin oxidoreductase [Flammeovirgaceae bacterium]MBR10163.1 flavin oxidoreductase [Rickettsiales bacterium]MBR11498.1 flavin oxidoreductase [Rickettsiales bacterium]|tara:strand:+ start:2970 stop:3593 length:624 start_codon:yes stop_codon:yes gene_type:complete